MLDVVRPSNRPELILRLFGDVLARPQLELAAIALVTELAERFRFDRVSVGLVDKQAVRVVARSHGLEISEGSESHRLLTAAMNESIEQSVSLVSDPSAPTADWVMLAHDALRRREGCAVATIPLAVEREAFGAVTLERNAPAIIGVAELAELEHMLGMIAPALHLMRQNDRSAWDWLKDRAQGWGRRVRSTENPWLRRGLVAAAAVFAGLLAVPVPQRVKAAARVEGEVQRVLVAPTDGFLKIAQVRAGDTVQAGQVMAELMDQDLNLERDRWASKLAQHETGYATAISQGDRSNAAVHLAQQSEAQSQLELVEQEISRASINAPFNGVVIQGDLSQSAGAPVHQGDTLFTIAPVGRFRVIVEVDERDIASIRIGQVGSLAISALPWETLPITVTRITPLATPIANRNVFEVEAQLRNPPAGLRPGLHGNARIAVGRRPLAISWAAALGARVRQLLWTWLP